MAIGALLLAVPANAGVGGYQCKNQWATAAQSTFALVIGNLMPLFILAVAGGGILAIMGMVFLHWSSMKGAMIGFLGTAIAAVIAVVVWPGVIETFTNAVC
jgi:hypothetical protein